MIPLVNKPMHARFSFHYSSLQLSFITQAWIFKLKLVLCKQPYEMHMQMHHTSSWACSPYLCAQNFNWFFSFVISLPLCEILPLSLSLYTILSSFVVFSLSLYIIFPSLSSMTTKVQNVDNTICRVEIINVNQWGEDHILKFGSS